MLLITELYSKYSPVATGIHGVVKLNVDLWKGPTMLQAQTDVIAFRGSADQVRNAWRSVPAYLLGPKDAEFLVT